MSEFSAIPDDMKTEIGNFATEIMVYVVNELEGGFWREKYEALSPVEKVYLFTGLSDGFGDWTEWEVTDE